MDHFPQLLQQLRRRRKLSKRRLSELCGLSPGVISLYESGKVIPSATSLIALADFFECSADLLLGRC